MKSYDIAPLIVSAETENITDLLETRVSRTPNLPLFSIADGKGNWNDLSGKDFRSKAFWNRTRWHLADSLCTCRVFVALVSAHPGAATASGAGTSESWTGSVGRMLLLDSTKPRDSVLAEWQCALELRATGRLDAIVPLLIGGPRSESMKAFPRRLLAACPDIVHLATVGTVRAQLGGAAPPTWALNSGTVQDIVKLIVDSAVGDARVKSWEQAATYLESVLGAPQYLPP